MTEHDELVVLQRAKEKFPNATPRIISDNGAQFVAKDFKEFIRICGIRYVEHYNQVRLHSAIGYLAPADKLAGREGEIFAVRDRKLAEARKRRKAQREATRLQAVA